MMGPSCVPNLKSPASAVAEILNGKPKCWGAPLVSSGSDFMMALDKPQSLAKFEVSLRLNVRLKGYVNRQANIPVHREIGGWFYHDFAAGSFHTKKLSSKLYSIELYFYSQKRQIHFLIHHLCELRVTYAVRTSSIVRWKAHGRLPIRYNWTFFASSYGWDVISRYSTKSALFRGGGSLWAQIVSGRECRPQPLVVLEN